MKLKIKDVKTMSKIEREKKYGDLKEELLKIRSSKSMGSTLTDPAKIRQIRKGIARILTVMRENEEI